MKIFISYAREDVAHVLTINQALDVHDVWFDQRLSVGQDWWSEIENQIASCHCFMYILSSQSIDSEYCQRELDYALKLGKPVAPILIERIEIPPELTKFQIIEVTDGFSSEAMTRLLNGLFEIERRVFNPLKSSPRKSSLHTKLSIDELYFATTNPYKKQMYEAILDATLQTAAIELKDIQHVDAGEVAVHKAKQAYDILRKPVFVEHSALSIRAWGGLPGGMTTCFIVAAGLADLCKMLQPFEDKFAETISVIAFTDGQLIRNFEGVLEGEIADRPRGNGYSWNNIFIPDGFDKTLGEMTEGEVLSISSRRRSIIKFMQFLQSNYAVE